MAILKFLHGKNFKDATSSFQPGTFYLDTETGEMWFDDPSSSTTDHSKIIDTDTLIYNITETIEWNGGAPSSSTSAVLGTAVLGTMVLGKS